MNVSITRIFIALTGIVLMTGCASQFELARSYSDNNQWLKSVIEYRKQFRENPDSVEAKTLLQQSEARAAEYYYHQGVALMLDNEFDDALIQFQQGLIAMPQSEKIQQAIDEVIAKKEAAILYGEALRAYELDDLAESKRLLQRALERNPNHNNADVLMRKVAEREQQDVDRNFILKSRKKIVLNFKGTSIKTAFEFVVKSYGVNVIFDDEVKDVKVTLYAKDVTFEQALGLLQRTTKTFYKIVGNSTLLIASDTDDKRNQYEDYIIRVFNLKAIEAKVMADILKSVIGINNIVINADMNSITLRDTEERLKLADELVSINDRKPAEMILEVEILEVNRSKTELLGLDFGSQVSMAYTPYTGSLDEALAGGVVTLPKLVLNYFKSDVDAKTLANPRIRVVDNKPAKIHIGDRVPLRSSTVQDATGQTRTAYEYRDIGIRLQVEPDIHLDNSVTVKLALEVSTLGENLGTVDEPAFRIGTRNADTTMILKDGETAILGGLIRDEDRNNRVKVPGLGDVPVLGALFTQYDDQDVRTDVLLTITPRVVRSWDKPSRRKTVLYSGTKKRYSTTPIFGSLDDGATETSLTQAEASRIMPYTPDNQYVPPSSTLEFNKSVYTVDTAEVVDVSVNFSGSDSVKYLDMEVLFDPALLEMIDYSRGTNPSGSLDVTADNEAGVIRLTANDLTGLSIAGESGIAILSLKSKRQGVSYLLHKTSGYLNASGLQERVNSSVSRIIVK